MLTGYAPICPALERVSTGPLNLSFFVAVITSCPRAFERGTGFLNLIARPAYCFSNVAGVFWVTCRLRCHRQKWQHLAPGSLPENRYGIVGWGGYCEVAVVGSVFEVAMCAGIGTLEVASVYV